MSPDNVITNEKVDAGLLPESQRENVPQPGANRLPSGVTETPQQTLQRARAMTVEPTVTAEQAVNPVTAPQVPQPQVGKIPSRVASTAQAVANESEQNFIAPQTEEARRLRELRGEQASLAGGGSLSDLFTEQQEAFGLPESVRELKDINLQLADMQTASDLTKTRIGAGNSIAQGNREIAQEDREAAVRQAGLAARAAVLQGNIETARQSALDAVNIEYQDRQLERQNLIDQINAIQPVVDEQTSQLLEQEKRQYEAELAATEELKDTIANAMVSGASQQEIARLTSDRVDDQTKLQLARTITARGATEMRDLEIEETRAGIGAQKASAAAAWALADQRATDTLLSLAEAGDQEAISELGLTMEDNTQPTSDEIAYARQYADTGDIPSGLSSAGISFGRIQELAADLPKAEGTLVSKNTGVAPGDLNATERTSYENLYNAVNTDLPVLIESFEEMQGLGNFGGTGIVGGIASTIKPSDANVRFEQAKADFLAKLLVARSGAAVTEQEYQRYAELLPGKFDTPAGLGTPGTEKLKGLNQQINSALQDKLDSRGLSIYGYSSIQAPDGQEYKVGEIITNEYGAKGRVNPDGSITPINSL